MAKPASTHVLEPYIPLLDKKSALHRICSDTVSEAKQLDAMKRAYELGDLVRLKSHVEHLKSNRKLAELSDVQRMEDVLREAAIHSIRCEGIVRKIEKVELKPNDVHTLENAVRGLESLGLGPRLWAATDGSLYPLLPKARSSAAYQERLHFLSSEFHAGCSRYCTAWLRSVEECELSSQLEINTAKWFECFPDSPNQLSKQLLEDDVRFSYEECPWHEREKLVPQVRDELRALGINVAQLSFRINRSFGPEGGVVVVVSGPSALLDTIRSATSTGCDRERAEFLNLGTEYDRDRARERAAALTLGELPAEEPPPPCARMPKPDGGMETYEEEEFETAKCVPNQGLSMQFDMAEMAKSVPLRSETVSPPSKGTSILGKMETLEQRDARVAEVLRHAGVKLFKQ